MSVYERVLQKLLNEELKSIPGLKQKKTKLAPGLLIVKQGIKYTIVKPIKDPEDSKKIAYVIRGYGRDNGIENGKHDIVVNSEEIKTYELV